MLEEPGDGELSLSGHLLFKKVVPRFLGEAFLGQKADKRPI